MWKRYIIVTAGPLFNLILPVIIFFFAWLSIDKTAPASVGTVLQGTPAHAAGLKPGDQILEVNGEKTPYWRDAVEIIETRPHQATKFVILRKGQRKAVTITPALHKKMTLLRVVKHIGRIGITLQYTRAQVGVIDRASPAHRAGLRTGDIVSAVDGVPVASWHELHQALRRAAGKPVRLALLRRAPPTFHFLDLREISHASLTVQPAEERARAVGWKAYGIEPASMFVDLVKPDTPAARAGLKVGDQVLSLNGKPLTSWLHLIEKLRTAPKKKHRLGWRTLAGETRSGEIRLKELKKKDEFKQERKIYIFGAYNRVDTWEPADVTVPFGKRFTYALIQAPKRTWEFCEIMVIAVAQLLRGKIPSSTIGGPIMLGYVANKAAGQGWETFLFIMALISINLALINLLPIPILDGGHILIFTIEAIRRKPISLSTRASMTTVGLLLIVLLMALAFFNDCNRYIFG
jgi:regulator of sigma E protease